MSGIILIIFLGILLALGFILGYGSLKEQTFKDFFIGKRNFCDILIVSTLFSSILSGNNVISTISDIYSGGYFYFYLFPGIFVSHLLMGLFISKKMGPYLGLQSPGDILGRMYGKEAKITMGITVLVDSMFMITIQVMAIVFLCEYFFAIPAILSISMTFMFILVYSLRGGIKAIIMNNVIQFGILIIFLPLLCCGILSVIGSIDNLLFYFTKNIHAKSEPFILSKAFAIFIYTSLPALYPLSIQRMLLCKDTQQIKTSFSINAVLSLIMIGMFVIIALYMNMINPNLEPKIALYTIINQVMPFALKNFILIALIAILISSINSHLNVATIAFTHDIYRSLSKKILSEQQQLILAKKLLFITAVLAIIIAPFGYKYINYFYNIRLLNDSTILVSLLMGFFGFNTVRKGFLTVLILSLPIMMLTYYVKYYYLCLFSTVICGLILYYFHYKYKTKNPNESYQKIFTDNLHKAKFTNKQKNFIDFSIKRIEYCLPYSTLAFISVMVPLFFIIPSYNLLYAPFFFIYPLIMSLCIVILFKEIWPSFLLNYFSYVWHLLLLLSLPLITILFYLQSNYQAIFILPMLSGVIILSLLTRKSMFILLLSLGLVLAFIISINSENGFYNYMVEARYLYVILYLLINICCLLAFSKIDKKWYEFITAKISHESARSLSAVSSSAYLLQNKMQRLINNYKDNIQQNLVDDQSLLKDDELQELQDLPQNLKDMGKRTTNTLDALFHKIDKERLSDRNLKTIDIISLVKQALADPSFTLFQKKKVLLNSYHNFFIIAVQAEITHVIINLLENAFAAIAHKEEYGIVEIWANNTSLFIRDNGVGIDSKVFYNIFDDGFSTKGSSGQGLGYCKRIMQEHAGNIYYTSAKNEFTQFELKFNEK